ncbi:hypothetical protein E2C01_002796 [Portunus trituberculatus]|uniref:Uncharacterized protein n=1 Tax=Portunus trituberculatus TaxID=210409 RepID=A0A5B7CKP7_PORTR|nr:hypothetical protein [Portunus trituberculatus]
MLLVRGSHKITPRVAPSPEVPQCLYSAGQRKGVTSCLGTGVVQKQQNPRTISDPPIVSPPPCSRCPGRYLRLSGRRAGGGNIYLERRQRGGEHAGRGTGRACGSDGGPAAGVLENEGVRKTGRRGGGRREVYSVREEVVVFFRLRAPQTTSISLSDASSWLPIPVPFLPALPRQTSSATARLAEACARQAEQGDE